MKILPLIAVLGLPLIFGCTAPQTTVSPFPIVTTNALVTPTPTPIIVTNVTVNTITGQNTVTVVTNIVVLPVTNFSTVTNFVLLTNTVYVADTNKINSIISTAQGINGATAAIDPYSAPIGWGLGIVGTLITLGSGILAKVKNDKANTFSTILTSVVKGVEAGTSTATMSASSVKSAIQDSATKAGVNDSLDKIVQANTKV